MKMKKKNNILKIGLDWLVQLLIDDLFGPIPSIEPLSYQIDHELPELMFEPMN